MPNDCPAVELRMFGEPATALGNLRLPATAVAGSLRQPQQDLGCNGLERRLQLCSAGGRGTVGHV